MQDKNPKYLKTILKTGNDLIGKRQTKNKLTTKCVNPSEIGKIIIPIFFKNNIHIKIEDN